MHQRAAGVRARSTLCHAAPSSRLNAAKKLSATAFVERVADAAYRLADELPGSTGDLSELRDPLETQLADKTDGCGDCQPAFPFSIPLAPITGVRIVDAPPGGGAGQFELAVFHSANEGPPLGGGEEQHWSVPLPGIPDRDMVNQEGHLHAAVFSAVRALPPHRARKIPHLRFSPRLPHRGPEGHSNGYWRQSSRLVVRGMLAPYSNHPVQLHADKSEQSEQERGEEEHRDGEQEGAEYVDHPSSPPLHVSVAPVGEGEPKRNDDGKAKPNGAASAARR